MINWKEYHMFADTPLGRYVITINHIPDSCVNYTISLGGDMLFSRPTLQEAQARVQSHLESTLKKLQEFLEPAEDNMQKAKRLYPPGAEIRCAFTLTMTGRVIGNYTFSPNGSVLAHADNGSRIALYHGPSNKWAVITKSQCGEGDVPADPLLEEAKRRYPPGTEARSVLIGSVVEIVVGDYKKRGTGNITVTTRDGEITVYERSSGRWAEIINPIKRLLEEAKRRYPVGTVFRSARRGRICVVNSGIIHDTEKYIYADNNAVYNKYESKWAEVIKFECPKCDGVTKDSNHCGNPCCPVQPCCGCLKCCCNE